MPLTPGKSQSTISENIKELHTGKTYARTSKQFGKAKANKQAIAIAEETAMNTGRGETLVAEHAGAVVLVDVVVDVTLGHLTSPLLQQHVLL